jgi:DNA-binding LytR/AlgR family response regulator
LLLGPCQDVEPGRLAAWGFVRVHRGELVQLARVRALHATATGAEVEFEDGQRAKASRRALPELRRRMRSEP